MTPDALSLSQSELPEEIATAIEALELAAHILGGNFVSMLDADEADRAACQAREALTAAILSRLANGAPASPSGSQASPEAPSDPRPAGFDPSRMQWRPIATAPRDGREILIYCDVTDQMFVAFADGAFWQYAYYTPAKRAIVLGNASHWMPLPPSPAQEAEAEGQDAKGGLVHGLFGFEC